MSAALPPADDIIAAAKALLADSDGTDRVVGKTYPPSVRTFTRAERPGDEALRYMRVSVHSAEDGTFDQFWDKFVSRYVKEVKKVTKILDVAKSQSVWSLYYKFPPPVSPRLFTELQTFYYVNESPRTGQYSFEPNAQQSRLTHTGPSIIVSLPVDLSGPEQKHLADLEEQGDVKGRYVSVERILEMDDGKVEWRMATASTPGGSIPKFLTEHSMPKSVAAVSTYTNKYIVQVIDQTWVWRS